MVFSPPFSVFENGTESSAERSFVILLVKGSVDRIPTVSPHLKSVFRSVPYSVFRFRFPYRATLMEVFMRVLCTGCRHTPGQAMAGATISFAAITDAATKSVLTVGSGDGSQQAACRKSGRQAPDLHVHGLGSRGVHAQHTRCTMGCRICVSSRAGLMLPRACLFRSAASTATRATTSTTSRARGCRCSSPWMPHSSGQAAGSSEPGATRASTSSAGTSPTRAPLQTPRRTRWSRTGS
jgi:hypothetical protein